MGEVSPSLRSAPAKRLAPFSVTPSAGTPRNAPKTNNRNSPLRSSAPGARNSHLYLPRFACADRPSGAPFGKGIRQLHLPPSLAWARAKACL